MIFSPQLFIICRSDSQNCSMATNITSWLHPTQGRCWTLSPKHGEPTDFPQTALQIFAFNENANWSPEVGLLPPEARRGEVRVGFRCLGYVLWKTSLEELAGRFQDL